MGIGRKSGQTRTSGGGYDVGGGWLWKPGCRYDVVGNNDVGDWV